MKFRLVEDRSNEINQAAKNYIANQMKHSNDRQLIDFADKILEKGSVRHHLDSSLGYESLSDAERKTGILGETISRNCRGKQKSASGLHWRFING